MKNSKLCSKRPNKCWIRLIEKHTWWKFWTPKTKENSTSFQMEKQDTSKGIKIDSVNLKNKESTMWELWVQFCLGTYGRP